jgi:hypothetical protein
MEMRKDFSGLEVGGGPMRSRLMDVGFTQIYYARLIA